MNVLGLRSLLASCVVVLTACSSITTPEGEDYLGHNIQCMRYFIYEMCARDYNLDNQVDFIYFDDTKEVFLYRGDLTQAFMVDMGFPIHRCVQVMNEPTQAAADKFLAINADTKSRDRKRIKTNLIEQYSTFAPDVKACNDRYNNKVKLPDLPQDDFGEEEYEEF